MNLVRLVETFSRALKRAQVDIVGVSLATSTDAVGISTYFRLPDSVSVTPLYVRIDWKTVPSVKTVRRTQDLANAFDWLSSANNTKSLAEADILDVLRNLAPEVRNTIMQRLVARHLLANPDLIEEFGLDS